MKGAGVVALVRCAAYSDAAAALARAAGLLGGLPFEKGARVLLKPNIVLGTAPEKATCTHPDVLAAAARHVSAQGALPFVGESPGGPFSAAWVGHSLRASGIEKAVLQAGASINSDFSTVEVDFPEGAALRRIPMCSFARSADAIVNVCKLKTHGMMTYTGAVKNLFGLVPGTRKAELHARFPDIPRFAAQINDIALCTGEALHIMDAVVGMEGEGPSHGQPRHVGTLLISRDPWALDHIASGMIGLLPEHVPILADAIARGLYDPAAVTVVGDDPSEFACAFQLPFARRHPGTSQGKAITVLSDAKPGIDKKRCVGCARCKDACPAQAIQMRGRVPHIDHKQCVRCYCCQELCPQGAVQVKASFLARFAK